MKPNTPARKAPITTPRIAVKPKTPQDGANKRPAIPAVSHRNSKQAKLIAKLGTPSGATIPKLMTLTGWQAHTVRAVISGVLRKKLGLKVTYDTSPKSRERTYRIAASTAST